jgi:diguanylate cyclase (GGDEF)-like protein
LTANGETIGTLALQENVTPTMGDEKAVSSIAWRRQLARSAGEHISLAISNLNLRDALRLEAIRDSLTGLYNRRYMEEFLERELRRAQRRGRPVAVMMLDLDHFKRYNDTLGHGAGDQALALVGETLLRSIRAEDVACRYGGEEFVIILPECALQPAMTRANDIRQRLSSSLTQGEAGLPSPLTVSIGVAGFDETTDRANLLLKFADQALYQAKRTGRNRVVAATPATSVDPVSLRAEPKPLDPVPGQAAQAASSQT